MRLPARAWDAAAASAASAATEAIFACCGEEGGTHTIGLSLWDKAGVTVPPETGDWYKSLGQGMGETLLLANEQGAYTITDRGTYLSQRDSLPDLVVLVGGDTIEENGDPALLNPYGVIPVNPDKGGINADLAQKFADWITSVEVQQMIEAYGRDEFGQPLFYPDSEAWINR